MDLSDFDFHLPEALIAQKPAERRDHSRLLVVHRGTGALEHRPFTAFPDFLSGHPLVVFNNTRVLPAKLSGRRADSDKPVEFLLVREETPATWLVLTRGLARMKPGQEFTFGKNLKAVFVGTVEDMARVRFSSAEALEATLQREGKMPLPHYIKRDGTGKPDDPELKKLDELDRERYQTVFAERAGAIAAPTAGLHFTPELLERVRQKAEVVFLTLHVGPGTFQPVRTERVEEHTMKGEYYCIPADTWNRILQAKKEGRKVLAIGTTTTRVLESVDFNQPAGGDVEGWTDRFLYPGQIFRNVDHLLTNFHLPRSTLFLLVCAFAGKPLMDQAYQTAITEKYRFFSYGDAMLIL